MTITNSDETDTTTVNHRLTKALLIGIRWTVTVIENFKIPFLEDLATIIYHLQVRPTRRKAVASPRRFIVKLLPSVFTTFDASIIQLAAWFAYFGKVNNKIYNIKYSVGLKNQFVG